MIKTGIKKVDYMLCQHDKEKNLWQCDLDGTKGKFTDINLEGNRSVNFFPLEESTAFHIRNAYCSIEGRKGHNLFCDTDREQLERTIKLVRIGWGLSK